MRDKHTLPFFTIIKLCSDWYPSRLGNVGFFCHVASSFAAVDPLQALVLQYAEEVGYWMLLGVIA